MKKILFLFLIPAIVLTSYPAAAAETGCIQGDCQNATGIMAFQNGSRYEGEFKDGKYSGRGTFYFANGSVYEGEYENGRYHGQGTFTYANGSRIL
jgi:hypothetical protein